MSLLGFMTSKRPAAVGPRNGKLSPCDPEKTNCVCSQHRLSEAHLGPHYVQPFPYTGDPADAMTRLVAVLLQQKNCRIISNRSDYLHAEFAGNTLGLVDDVEFLLAAEDHLIHVRSASRLGMSDFGLNRARVEELRGEYEDADEE